MADPQTLNTGLSIPARGTDVGVWDVPLNGDFVALDGYQGGVLTLGVSNANVALTAPTAFTATPSAGPVQSQNAVLRVTGTMTINVQIKLPLPGYYIVENLTTAGGNILQFAAASPGEVICVDRGDVQHIYNDGTNVRFVNMGRLGHMEMWAGLSALPAWVSNCTVPPFILCDGSIYNFSAYPYLGARLGSLFGGNGTTTFGVPDLRGRVPLAFDGTGGRITAAVCGLNGQQMGAAIDTQGVVLTAAQIPAITSNQNGITTTSTPNGGGNIPVTGGTISSIGSSGGSAPAPSSTSAWGTVAGNSFNSAPFNINVQSNNTSGQVHPNVQPSQVAGIWVIKAA